MSLHPSISDHAVQPGVIILAITDNFSRYSDNPTSLHEKTEALSVTPIDAKILGGNFH